MSGDRVANPSRLLLDALRAPQILEDLPPAETDVLLRAANRGRLLSRLAVIAFEAGVEPRLHPRVIDRLVAARAIAEHHERSIYWETNRLRRALRGIDVRIVLLKGAAYLMAGLPASRGRLASDVDILVPRDRLDEVERALLAAGWVSSKPDAYDQRYYRQWMHELPPMQHGARRTILDVHHTIVPPTGRLHPDAAELLGAARPSGREDLWVLSPEDMVLHSATHLFHDGDLSEGLRDLIDLDDLLRHFGEAEAGFWDRLVPRAARQDLLRPLYYGLRYCRTILDTPVPAGVLESAEAGRPAAPVASAMDRLVRRALAPDGVELTSAATGAARWLLFVRSHWLRMPLHLLVPHLTRKAWTSMVESRKDDLA